MVHRSADGVADILRGNTIGKSNLSVSIVTEWEILHRSGFTLP
jgi:hypothetical protein